MQPRPTRAGTQSLSCQRSTRQGSESCGLGCWNTLQSLYLYRPKFCLIFPFTGRIMPKGPKSHRALSFQKCQRCRYDKAKVIPLTLHTCASEADSKCSAYPKIEHGRDLVACDVNALTTHAQEAARKLRKRPAITN